MFAKLKFRNRISEAGKTPRGDDVVELSPWFRKKNITRINKRKIFNASGYDELLAPYRDSHENLRYSDFVRESEIGERKILLIRHDVDHDHLTAVRIAEWEAERGFKATYCLLHTAWYYGILENGEYRHSTDLIECVKRLHALGHEINFHNNLVATALREGTDAVEMLRKELLFFRSLGIAVTGTSTHGDELCRDLNFRNWEIFSECCDDRFGGPRTISYDNQGRVNTVELGAHSMFDFDLEYEGYDVKRDIYHTDSGGRPRTRYGARGRRPFGRKDESRGEIVGILTHPIWWDFSS